MEDAAIRLSFARQFPDSQNYKEKPWRGRGREKEKEEKRRRKRGGGEEKKEEAKEEEEEKKKQTTFSGAGN